jgi:ATP-dependent metalloprotease
MRGISAPNNQGKQKTTPDKPMSLFTLLSGNSGMDVKLASNIKERLSDVKGISEINEEINELLDMIKNRSKYTERGAKLPKGILFVGSPGTGKTLLARAIAGESGINFIFTTGASFDEMFVGVGAKRVREIFKTAKEKQPCIIFIDEIDTLLSNSRRGGLEHSSSSATINQLLSEIDGFDQTHNILVIGATNNPDQLDPAAVRPGRFDLKIQVPLPDQKGRKEILDFYLAKVVSNMEIDSEKLAKLTPGFSGAELENLVNFAAIYSVSSGKNSVTMLDFEKACDRLRLGVAHKRLMTADDKFKTALHEMGHTIACLYLRGAERIYKTTIVPRGQALGVTFMIPTESELIGQSKEQLLSSIDVALGGYCAEKLVLGEKNTSTGVSNDLEGATNIANLLIRQFGMASEDFGLSVSNKFDTSDVNNAKIEEKVNALLKVYQ